MKDEWNSASAGTAGLETWAAPSNTRLQVCNLRLPLGKRQGPTQPPSIMVLHVIAIGAAVLLGRAVNAGLEAHERKKQARAVQESLASDTNVPKGYAPQKALLFDNPLLPGETLVATFEFTPAKWVRKLFSSDEVIPNSLGRQWESATSRRSVSCCSTISRRCAGRVRGVVGRWRRLASTGVSRPRRVHGGACVRACVRDRAAYPTCFQARSSNTA